MVGRAPGEGPIRLARSAPMTRPGRVRTTGGAGLAPGAGSSRRLSDCGRLSNGGRLRRGGRLGDGAGSWRGGTCGGGRRGTGATATRRQRDGEALRLPEVRVDVDVVF